MRERQRSASMTAVASLRGSSIDRLLSGTSIDKLIDADEKTSKQSIVEAVWKHCGDLQNEKPNPARSQKDRKMCYYFEPIRAAIAQPFSTRMPSSVPVARANQPIPGQPATSDFETK